MCADFLENNYDRVSFLTQSLILNSKNAHTAPNILLKCLSGLYRIREASAFRQLRHQTTVFEGKNSSALSNKDQCAHFAGLCVEFNKVFIQVCIIFQLLGELLLDRHNFTVMTKYISRAENLKLMMNMLRDNSRNIQFEAFHVFKVC